MCDDSYYVCVCSFVFKVDVNVAFKARVKRCGSARCRDCLTRTKRLIACDRTRRSGVGECQSAGNGHGHLTGVWTRQWTPWWTLVSD